MLLNSEDEPQNETEDIDLAVVEPEFSQIGNAKTEDARQKSLKEVM